MYFFFLPVLNNDQLLQQHVAVNRHGCAEVCGLHNIAYSRRCRLRRLPHRRLVLRSLHASDCSDNSTTSRTTVGKHWFRCNEEKTQSIGSESFSVVVFVVNFYFYFCFVISFDTEQRDAFTNFFCMIINCTFWSRSRNRIVGTVYDSFSIVYFVDNIVFTWYIEYNSN